MPKRARSGDVSIAYQVLGEGSDLVYLPPLVSSVDWNWQNPSYARFLRRLEASPWLMNVVPVEAGTVIEGNRAVNTFTIQATYVRADTSIIETVPVLESVVR